MIAITWEGVGPENRSVSLAATQDLVSRDPSPPSDIWEKPLSGSWKGRGLRKILQQITENQGVQFVLDRRVDPDQEIEFSSAGQTAEKEVELLARQVGQKSVVLGDVAYIGPPEVAKKLMTLVVLRKEDLIPRRRSPVGSWMLSKQTLGWEDLETPREILERWLGEQEIRLTNPEVIPLDRWGGTTLSGLTPVEEISLLLIQCDLTFELQVSKKTCQLIPIPGEISLTRNYPWSKSAQEETAADRKERELQLATEFPGLSLEFRKQTLVARGSWEELTALGESLTAPRVRGANESEAPEVKPVPLAQRRFTLKLENVSLRAVMQELEQSGIEFDYDPLLFEELKINLETTPRIDVQDLSPSDFFARLFEPLGVHVVIDGNVVKLLVGEK